MARLAKLDARADALEATLRRTEDQIFDRIERSKDEVHQALDKLKADIDKQLALSEARKQKIFTEIDNLKAQAALGKAEARDAFAAARRRIHESARKVEAEVESALQGVNAERLDASIYVYVHATDTLDAAYEAAEARFASLREKVDAALEGRRQEISQQLADFRQRLGERNAQTAEQLARFEERLRGGFEQMAKAAKDLFA